MAREVRVLSAGAVKPGMVKVVDAFRRESGCHVKVDFATAPEILKRIGGGENVEVVIAPPAVLDELVKAGKAAVAGHVTVGRIGVGVMVRADAPRPKIGDVDEFKESLLNAESVVYNQASTGIYLEGLFGRLGVAGQLEAKTARYPDFAAVLDHVSKGKGSEIGLGATTVIVASKNKGVALVGPLPAEIQNHTTYAATVMPGGSDAGRELVRYLTTPAARMIFAAAGIE